jgi:hypothetical protein
MWSGKIKKNPPVYTDNPVKKTMLQKVMRPKDWVMLGILLVVSAVCWTWVWRAYQEPFVYDDFFISSDISAEAGA